MSRFFSYLTVFCFFVFLSGCSKPMSKDAYEEKFRDKIHDEEVVVAEIAAVRMVKSEVEREELYGLMAERTGLSGYSQVRLVDAVFLHLKGNISKESVLVELIGNEDFACSAKMRILEKLKRLGPSSRRNILKAFYERGSCVDDLTEAKASAGGSVVVKPEVKNRRSRWREKMHKLGIGN